MQIQKINRTDAERIDIIVHNVEGATISLGMGAYVVGFTAGTQASNDGASVMRLATGTTGDAQMQSFAGIALRDIPADGYGMLRSWGYVNSVLLSQETDKTIGVFEGMPSSMLKPGGAAGTFTSVYGNVNLSTLSMAGAHARMSKYITILNTVNISSPLPYCKAFVRAI
jgi:hypothetical protein